MTSTKLARRAPAPIVSLDDLTGTQKAAIVLMAMGRDASAKITQTLAPADLEQIAYEIARLDSVPSDVTRAVVLEWEQMETAAHSIAQGGVDYAREVLEQAVGPQKAASILKRIETQLRDNKGFANLRHADPQQISGLVRNEHPQTVALLLAHLDPNQTAAVLKELPTALGGEVMYRLARMEKVLPEVLQVLERSYGADSSVKLSQDVSVAGGPQSVAAVLNLLVGTLEKELLESIGRQDPELCEEIKNLMFVFEDLMKLDDKSLQRVLKDVDTKELALALKGSSDGMKTRVFAMLSKRAGDALREEMEFLGPARVRDVEAAQAKVVRAVRVLEEQGEVVLGGAGDDLVE